MNKFLLSVLAGMLAACSTPRTGEAIILHTTSGQTFNTIRSQVLYRIDTNTIIFPDRWTNRMCSFSLNDWCPPLEEVDE